MATITEDYVSFETAKLLKEKGFDVPCMGRYSVRSKEFHLDCTRLCNNGGLFVCATPTLQMAMKWLRETHNLFIEIQCYGCESDKEAHFEYSYIISEYVKINNGICTIFGLEKRNAKSRFLSYEEAVEAAIKYCLENLI